MNQEEVKRKEKGKGIRTGYGEDEMRGRMGKKRGRKRTKDKEK